MVLSVSSAHAPSFHTAFLFSSFHSVQTIRFHALYGFPFFLDPADVFSNQCISLRICHSQGSSVFAKKQPSSQTGEKRPPGQPEPIILSWFRTYVFSYDSRVSAEPDCLKKEGSPNHQRAPAGVTSCISWLLRRSSDGYHPPFWFHASWNHRNECRSVHQSHFS